MKPIRTETSARTVALHARLPSAGAVPRGFSLLELMFTLGIVSTLAVLSYAYGRGDMRARQFTGAQRAVLHAIAVARGNAMSTGVNSSVSIEGGVVVAFVDADHDKTYSSADRLLYRYPEAAGQTLPSGQSITSVTLRELGTEPQTAMFDGRGFYIDSFSGYSVHDANVCVADTVLGRQVNVQLSRFGWSGVTDAGRCGEQPICPH